MVIYILIPMTIQEEIEALKAEIADAKARTAEANVQIAAYY